MTGSPVSKPVSIWHLYLIECADGSYYLYLIECADGSYYTGVTTNVERRYEQHLLGKGARYTRSHKPLRLLASRAIGTRSEALKAELAVKRLPKEEKVSAVALPMVA